MRQWESLHSCSCVLLVTVLLCCAACETRAPAMPGGLDGTSPTSAAMPQFDVPWPGAVPADAKQVADLGPGIFRSGRHCFAMEHATPDDATGCLGLAAGAQQISWGMYRFNPVISTDGPFRVSVELAGAAPECLYLGVADFTRGCWRWTRFNAPGDALEFEIPPAWNIAGPADAAYATVLAWDGAAATVAGVTLHMSLVPVPGIVFSPYLEDGPDDGASVTQAQVAELLKAVAPFCQSVCVCGSMHGLEYVPPLAKSLNITVAAACWLSDDTIANEAEIAALIEAIQRGEVALAIVGSEVLYRGELDEVQLISYLQRIKAACNPDITKVTTNDTWNELLEHPNVLAECDVIMASIYPYWQGISYEKALKRLNYDYCWLRNEVHRTYPGIPVLIGETSWPSAGNQIGEAIPSPEHAAGYFLSFATWARELGVQYYFFEAFDEKWKTAEGPQGTHLGIWEQSGEMKPGMMDTFRGLAAADTWSSPGPPTISLNLPPYGSFEPLTGLVSGVNFADYRVAVYICVNGGWWTKPEWNYPLTVIDWEGNFTCLVTTGGQDETATQMAAFVVPYDYTVPLLGGDSEIPASFTNDPLVATYVIEDRLP